MMKETARAWKGRIRAGGAQAESRHKEEAGLAPTFMAPLLLINRSVAEAAPGRCWVHARLCSRCLFQSSFLP